MTNTETKFSEEILLEILDNSPIPKAILNENFNFEFLNKSFIKTLGYTIKDLPTLEDWWLLAYPDEDYRKSIEKSVLQILEQSIKENRSTKQYKITVICKNGEEKSFSVSGVKIQDKIYVEFIDLTEHLVLEKEKDLFFEVSGSLMCIVQNDGYFKSLNSVWTEILGWRIEELLLKPFIDFLHPDDISSTKKEIENLYSGIKTVNFINRYKCKDGNYKWFNWSAVASGNLIYGSAIDITELKEAQVKLEQQRKQFEAMLDAIPEIIYVSDTNTYEVVFVNKYFMDILGYNPVGKKCYEAFQGFETPCRFCTNEILKKSKKEYRWEYRNEILKKDYNLIDKIIKWSDGRDVRFEIAIDITAQKQNENKTNILLQKLNKSNQELEQFAYIASHDLQEPLRMVSSFTQLLEKKYNDVLNDEGRQYIYFASDGAKRMQILINDLLTFSRISTRDFQVSKFSLTNSLEEAISNLKVKIEENSVSIKYPSLPEIVGDKNQITRLFQNLIDNSIKYRSEKDPVINVSYELDNNAAINIVIKDNGMGFNKKYKEKVFIMFKRLQTKEKFSGTGIGLAVCKKIVEKHGGQIWAESEENLGTKIYITLKINNEDPNE